MSKALMKHKQELVVLEFLKNTYNINVSLRVQPELFYGLNVRHPRLWRKSNNLMLQKQFPAETVLR